MNECMYIVYVAQAITITNFGNAKQYHLLAVTVT